MAVHKYNTDKKPLCVNNEKKMTPEKFLCKIIAKNLLIPYQDWNIRKEIIRSQSEDFLHSLNRTPTKSF